MLITRADWLVLIFYFAIVAAIGVVASLRVRGTSEYFLGGRRFGKLVMMGQVFSTGDSCRNAREPDRRGIQHWGLRLFGISGRTFLPPHSSGSLLRSCAGFAGRRPPKSWRIAMVRGWAESIPSLRLAF